MGLVAATLPASVTGSRVSNLCSGSARRTTSAARVASAAVTALAPGAMTSMMRLMSAGSPEAAIPQGQKSAMPSAEKIKSFIIAAHSIRAR